MESTGIAQATASRPSSCGDVLVTPRSLEASSLTVPSERSSVSILPEGLKALELLLCNPPFPWQERLLDMFLRGQLPSALDIPTGLGKTSVIAIWTLARSMSAPLPRRLAYVVDRRAVVDQASAEALTLAQRIAQGTGPVFAGLRQGLGLAEGDGIAFSMLRGQHPDNRIWSLDPARPAILVGTVDMIGSRLLFEGYGASRRMRPYQAGLLGQDTLVVLDEAHLVPAFEALLRSAAAADPEFRPAPGLPPLRLLSLSATGREVGDTALRLEARDLANPIVSQRVGARKHIRLHAAVASADLARTLAELAVARAEATPNARIVVFCNSRRDALKVKAAIAQRQRAAPIELLVGERRVREREALADWIARQGFVAGSGPREGGPAFLVATSAGEVGVDLDADHMIGDLVAWERMVQRFGRINRRGTGEAWIDVIPELPKEDQPINPRSRRAAACAAVLERLPAAPGGGLDASPAALGALRGQVGNAAIEAASTPAPLRPALTRALLDAWSLTSLHDHPGRPEIGPWLRGWQDEEPQVALVWRRHLPWHAGMAKPTGAEVAAFFEAAAPQRSEVLEARPWDVLEVLKARAARSDHAPDMPAVLVLSPGGGADSLTIRQLRDFKADQAVRRFADRTVVVAAALGGLSPDGLLDQGAEDIPATLDGPEGFGDALGLRVLERRADQPPEAGWTRAHEWVVERNDEGAALRVLAVEAPLREPQDPALRPVVQALSAHTSEVVDRVRDIAARLGLPASWTAVLVIAAWLHDQGKRREAWQDAMALPSRGRPYAKSAARSVNQALLNGYRHEFGSLAHAAEASGFSTLAPEWQDLVLHLVAAHHGWARPLIEARDPEAPDSALRARATEVALRFARLQRRWGPWGLAWWEALLRAADMQASAAADARQEGV